MDQRTAVRLQGLREPVGPGAEERERMVLVGHPGQAVVHEPDAGRLDVQPVEQERPQEDAAAGQRRVRHQRHRGVVPERVEQRVRRRHRVARHRLLPREAVRVRGQRRAAQLRGRHQPDAAALGPSVPSPTTALVPSRPVPSAFRPRSSPSPTATDRRQIFRSVMRRRPTRKSRFVRRDNGFRTKSNARARAHFCFLKTIFERHT